MLNRTCQTLPASFYFDPAHFQKELQAIWWKEWFCIGRESEWSDTGSYQLVRLGDQQIIVTRCATGRLRAFHNTCRHRGAQLCAKESGKFRNERIICPYHAWAYSLEGELAATPRRPESSDFQAQDFSLYAVNLDTWEGFVFINLAAPPAAGLQSAVGPDANLLANWPLKSLALAHREIHTLRCNWKIFWENYLECYHCPGVHPELSRLVPLYRQGVVSADDLSDENPLKSSAPLRAGAVTWSDDGQTPLPWFAGLSDAEQAAGMTFADCMPSMFIVAHVDYVRSVRLLPLGPEETTLTVDWFLDPEVLGRGNVDIARLTGFGNRVVSEDARVCEINQRGLHSLRHQHGVILPHEHGVLEFSQWIRERLNMLRQT